jgi:hypothetical protein
MKKLNLTSRCILSFLPLLYCFNAFSQEHGIVHYDENGEVITIAASGNRVLIQFCEPNTVLMSLKQCRTNKKVVLSTKKFQELMIPSHVSKLINSSKKLDQKIAEGDEHLKMLEKKHAFNKKSHQTEDTISTSTQLIETQKKLLSTLALESKNINEQIAKEKKTNIKLDHFLKSSHGLTVVSSEMNNDLNELLKEGKTVIENHISSKIPFSIITSNVRHDDDRNEIKDTFGNCTIIRKLEHKYSYKYEDPNPGTEIVERNNNSYMLRITYLKSKGTEVEILNKSCIFTDTNIAESMDCVKLRTVAIDTIYSQCFKDFKLNQVVRPKVPFGIDKSQRQLNQKHISPTKQIIDTYLNDSSPQ